MEKSDNNFEWEVIKNKHILESKLAGFCVRGHGGNGRTHDACTRCGLTDGWRTKPEAMCQCPGYGNETGPVQKHGCGKCGKLAGTVEMSLTEMKEMNANNREREMREQNMRQNAAYNMYVRTGSTMNGSQIRHYGDAFRGDR